MSETANTARQCVGGGYLVGPVFRVPTNFAYFQTPGAQFVVGCNQLRCKLCGATVREQSGLHDGPDAATNAAAIFTESDWSQSRFLLPDVEARTYCCKCSLVIIRARQATHMPNDVWTCQGHPPVPGNEGSLLPTMTLSAAQDFAVTLANGQLQQSINLIAITFTDGTGTRALPANIGLRPEWPELTLYTAEHQQTPILLDFNKVAGACVQLADKTLKTF